MGKPTNRYEWLGPSFSRPPNYGNPTTRLRHKCVVPGRYEASILDSDLGSGVGVWGPVERG
jgi:hypothetical protein